MRKEEVRFDDIATASITTTITTLLPPYLLVYGVL